MRKVLLAAILVVVSLAAEAAELTLFDIPLRTASRDQIRTAIKSAGGHLQSTTRDTDNFDASRIGLPGAQTLEVIFLEDKFVLAQYHLQFHDSTESERLRKMIVLKYGQPTSANDYGRRGSEFDSQYAPGGKHVWRFDGNMELVANVGSFSAFDLLTYVSRTEQARLERIVKDQDNKAAQRDAAAKKSMF